MRLLPAILVALTACWAPSLAPSGEEEGSEEGAPSFVADGLVVGAEVGVEGVPLSEGRVLVERAWTPGEKVEVVGRRRRVIGTAPATPRCVLLFRTGVGNSAPDTIRFDAAGQRLELTWASGRVQRVDAWRGELIEDAEGTPMPLAAARPAPVPASCPAESAAGPALVAPDGYRHLVLEGPITERSGETNWRLAMFR